MNKSKKNIEENYFTFHKNIWDITHDSEPNNDKPYFMEPSKESKSRAAEISEIQHLPQADPLLGSYSTSKKGNSKWSFLWSSVPVSGNRSLKNS